MQNRIDQFVEDKKRQEQLDALRRAIPEPTVQNFRNLYFTYAGQRHTLTQWSKILGVHYSTLVYRYRKGKRGDALFSSATYARIENTPAIAPDYAKPIPAIKHTTPVFVYDQLDAVIRQNEDD